MQKWEHLSVVFSTDGVGKTMWARFINNQELTDWKNGPTMQDYIRQLGEEGWELVTIETGGLFWFKRPKP
jgi:hypothetical protein